MTSPILELELEDRLVKAITRFLMELGNGFTFIGNQHVLEYNGKESKVDMLFFHRGLRCLVAIDLKIGAFKPEYAGKMNYYLSLLDRLERGADENLSRSNTTISHVFIRCHRIKIKCMTTCVKMCPVPLGDAIVTTAGKLKKQKYIYHCVTLDKKRRMQILASQVTEEDVLNYLLQHAIDKCFLLMQAMELTSIAFPAIGAGAARIPIKKVIEQMSIAIARNLASTNKSLNVELYLYDMYNLYNESDYITLFETFAAKAAL